MTLLLLEALGALLLFVFIVWWTMFAGRKRGEPADADQPASPSDTAGPTHSATDTPRPGEPPR
ncbi:MAG: hypothetical protein N2Z61_01245 [Tepidimonas fonticaldi]|uniref:hypothetical protein n=1 Tax=Tepidimonas fonticaldi TaxID=1101373 RepID=UPI0009EDC1D4|nr:hypothetical protein [Tepidimonas fonticaldi]MCX7662364.1 hypothetical protein [Tepidimonas fonticaldi]